MKKHAEKSRPERKETTQKKKGNIQREEKEKQKPSNETTLCSSLDRVVDRDPMVRPWKPPWNDSMLRSGLPA